MKLELKEVADVVSSHFANMPMQFRPLRAYRFQLVCVCIHPFVQAMVLKLHMCMVQFRPCCQVWRLGPLETH